MTNQQLQPGALLQGGKYRIERILGQGGFGITYLATQELLDRRVAVKEFFMRDFCSRGQDTASVTLGTASNREFMERYRAKFLKEAKVIAQLNHPNIIRIYDIFEENGTAYYVMEYIEGESLSDMVKRRGALPEQEAVAYIRSVAEALKYVHARSTNHLDVKPGNIMVQRTDNRVFLLDFGLSKQYDTDGSQTSSTPLGISHGYAPIEQYSPEGVRKFSPQTDVYALGATLYYLVTGHTPPAAGELLSAPLEGFPPAVSPAVREAVIQAMQVRKQDRPATVEQFEALLPGKPNTQTEMESGKTPEEEETRPLMPENKDEDTEQTHILNPETPRQPEDPARKTASGETPPKPLVTNKKQVKIALSIGAALLLIVLVVNLFLPKNAEELFQEGYDAYLTADYATAEDLFQQSAEKGYADAQARLGDMYYESRGVTQDYFKAADWYLKAAEQGNAHAQFMLGVMYENGEGVEKDDEQAVVWYTRAAEQGTIWAQYNLGLMYYNGKGVAKDYGKAAQWISKAAEQGDADAQVQIGYMYESGEGVAKDEAKAAEWYRKAAEQGDTYGQCNLGNMYEYGKGVAKDLEQAFEWYAKAAEQGHARAQNNLGILYEQGEGVAQDYAKALEWYTKSAEQGYAYAQSNLGDLYYYGRGVAKDYSKAFKWYLKAAGQGHGYACYSAGWMYEHGEGVAKNYSEAVRRYKLAANSGNNAAKQRLKDLGETY